LLLLFVLFFEIRAFQAIDEGEDEDVVARTKLPDITIDVFSFFTSSLVVSSRLVAAD
jgi:hypothetical protein